MGTWSLDFFSSPPLLPDILDMRRNNHKNTRWVRAKWGPFELLWPRRRGGSRRGRRRRRRRRRQWTSPPFRHIPSHGTIRYDENGSVNSGDAVYVLDTLKNRLRGFWHIISRFWINGENRLRMVHVKCQLGNLLTSLNFLGFFFFQFCEVAKMAIIIHKLINIAKFGYTQ